MKIVSVLLLFTSAIAANADLYDQRAAQSAAQQEVSSEQAAQQLRSIERENLYILARAFGETHQGVGQFEEMSGTFGGGIRSLRFVSGDGYACEAYHLSFFRCYDSTSREVRFSDYNFVNRKDDYTRWTPIHAGQSRHRR